MRSKAQTGYGRSVHDVLVHEDKSIWPRCGTNDNRGGVWIIVRDARPINCKRCIKQASAAATN